MAFFMEMLLFRPRTKGHHPTKRPCPVSKLPAELLVEIFLYVVSSSSSAPAPEKHPTLYAPHTTSYLSCASPLSLSHVCRAWRAVSLSLPRLWTSLRVVHPKNPRILPLLSLWIQRSRSHDLDLSLYQLHGHGQANIPLDDAARKYDLEFEATRQVCQLFLTVVDRWRHVEMNVCMSFKSLLNKISGTLLEREWSTSLPLEDIKVTFGPCTSGHYGKNGDTDTLVLGTEHHPILSDESTFFSYLLRCSPHLRTLEWDNRYVPIPVNLIAEWPTLLTDITLYGSQDIVSILSGLSKCKSLRTLTIYEQTVFSPNLDHHHAAHHLTPLTLGKLSPLDFPGLQVLRLGTFPHPELLFSNLVVPNLRTLTVLRGYNGRRGWRGLTRTSWFTLSEMLIRSVLKNLSIEIGGVVLDFTGELDGLHV